MSAREDGLGRLDAERAESMASEGGRSAQAIEARAAEPSLLPSRARAPWWMAAALGACGALLAYGLARRAR